MEFNRVYVLPENNLTVLKLCRNDSDIVVMEHDNGVYIFTPVVIDREREQVTVDIRFTGDDSWKRQITTNLSATFSFIIDIAKA